MNHTIINFLNLKEDTIESIASSSLGGDLIVEFSLKRTRLTCSKCGCVTNNVMNHYTRKINHGIIQGRKCRVHYKQKRYKCIVCGHTFNETNTLVQKHQKKSLASHIRMMEYLKDPKLTFKQVGEYLDLSTNTIMDTFYENVPQHKAVLPRALCIDEVYLGRKATKKYVAVLLDFEENRIVDIIYGRTKDSLHSYFQLFPKEALNKVEYISSDMYEGYRFLKRHYFKNARLCTDSFHVIQLINTMFNDQIKGIMKRYERRTDEYYLLKTKRHYLLQNNSSVEWDKQVYDKRFRYYVYLLNYKEQLLNIDPLIKEIYELKEAYISFNRLKDKSIIQEEMDKIINRFITHSNKDVAQVGRTLNKWKVEIYHSFTWFGKRRLSNGPIESRNRTIKLIINNAAGYRNFDHLRRRIIYCINHRKNG